MLNQQRSGNLARLKYLMAAPICAGLLCVSTLAFSKTYGWVDLAPANIKSNIPAPSAAVNKKKRIQLTKIGSGITTITDKFSVEHNGKKTFYTVDTITPADIDDLFKYDGMKVKIIAADKSLQNPPEAAYDGRISARRTTSKGYSYVEEGTLINHISNYKVIIFDKNSVKPVFSRNTATPAEIKLLKDKYGYTFPTTPVQPGTKQVVDQVKFPPPTIKPVKDQVKFPPPVLKPVKDQVKFPPPVITPDQKATYLLDPNYTEDNKLEDTKTKLAEQGYKMIFERSTGSAN